MALMDAYGLSMVSVQAWGLIWGALSAVLILGGLLVSRTGLGSNPVRLILLANLALWTTTVVFPLQNSIVWLSAGMVVYMALIPYVEAAEQTVLQKVVPYERQGRVFGFAQSVEQAASPLTAFLISPLAQFAFIPFMTDGRGADWIGGLVRHRAVTGHRPGLRRHRPAGPGPDDLRPDQPLLPRPQPAVCRGAGSRGGPHLTDAARHNGDCIAGPAALTAVSDAQPPLCWWAARQAVPPRTSPCGTGWPSRPAW